MIQHIMIIFGCILIIPIYFFIRNEWVYKIRDKMIDEIYKNKMNSIVDGIYSKNNYKSYDEMPDYQYMLFYKFYKWDKYWKIRDK